MAVIHCSECGAGIKIPDERMGGRFAFSCPRCGTRQHHEPEVQEPADDLWAVPGDDQLYTPSKPSPKSATRLVGAPKSGKSGILPIAVAGGAVLLMALGVVCFMVLGGKDDSPSREHADPPDATSPLPIQTTNLSGGAPPVSGSEAPETPEAARELKPLQRMLSRGPALIEDLPGRRKAPTGFGEDARDSVTSRRIDGRMVLVRSSSWRSSERGNGVFDDDGNLCVSVLIQGSPLKEDRADDLFTLIDHTGKEYKSVNNPAIALKESAEIKYKCPRDRAYTVKLIFAMTTKDRYWMVKPTLTLDASDMTPLQKARTDFVDRCIDEEYLTIKSDRTGFTTSEETWRSLSHPERKLLTKILWGYVVDRRADLYGTAITVGGRRVARCVGSVGAAEVYSLAPVVQGDPEEQFAEVKKAGVLLPGYMQQHACVNDAWFELDAVTRRKYATVIVSHVLGDRTIKEDTRIPVTCWNGPFETEVACWTAAEGLQLLDESDDYKQGLETLKRLPEYEASGLLKKIEWNTLCGAQVFVDAGAWNRLSQGDQAEFGRALSCAALVKQKGRHLVLIRTEGAGEACEHALARVYGGEIQPITWDPISWSVAAEQQAPPEEDETIPGQLEPAEKVRRGCYIDEGAMVSVDASWWHALSESEAIACMNDWLDKSGLDGDIYSALYVCDASSDVLLAYMTARSHQAIFWNPPDAGTSADGGQTEPSDFPTLLREGIVRGVKNRDCYVDFRKWKAATADQQKAWERAIVKHGAQVYGEGIESLYAWPYDCFMAVMSYNFGDNRTDAIVMADEMPGPLLQKYGQSGVLHSYDASNRVATVDFRKWLETPTADRVEMLKQFGRGAAVKLQFIPPLGYAAEPGGSARVPLDKDPFELTADEVAWAKAEYEKAKEDGRLIYTDFGWTSYAHVDKTTITMSAAELTALFRAIYLVALDGGAGPVMYFGTDRHCGTYNVKWDVTGFTVERNMNNFSPIANTSTMASRQAFLWLRKNGIVRNMLYSHRVSIDERIWYLLPEKEKMALGWTCLVGAALEGGTMPRYIGGMMTGRQVYPPSEDVADPGAHEASSAPYLVVGEPDRAGKAQIPAP